MSIDLKLTIDAELIECPFLSICGLPKIQFLCKIPNCRNCPDYTSKLEKIK